MTAAVDILSGRQSAEQRFQSLPFPSAKDENYRFTPIEHAILGASSTANVGSAAPAAPALLEGEGALLALSGETATTLGDTKGFLLSTLERAAELGSPLVRELLETAPFLDDKYAQLAAARWKNGAIFQLAANVKLTVPVRISVSVSGQEEFFRHLIVLDAGAEATVVLDYTSDAARRFSGDLLELRLGAGAKLRFVLLQSLGAGTDFVSRHAVTLGKGAELVFTPLHTGGAVVQARQHVKLGELSSLDTRGAARGDGQQHFDSWLTVHHEGSRSRSNMEYWYVMAEKAKGVFNAEVKVEKNAADCESAQRSRSLLLGSGSVHAIPRLLILTDAVKAAHGASVSTVNFEQLHYLQSRGIPRVEAERMIVRGFTEVVVDRFPYEALQARAEALLDGKQGGGA